MTKDAFRNFRKNFVPSFPKNWLVERPEDGKILQLVPDAVVGCNSTGMIIHWDDRAEKIFGWKASEVQGRSIAEILIPLEFRALHTNGMKRMVETGESRVIDQFLDLTALTKEGARLPIEMMIKQTRSAGEIFFFSFIRESTQKSNLKKKLKGSELTSQVLRLALEFSRGQIELEVFLKSLLGTLGAHFGASLSFAFEMEEDFFNLLPAVYNQTGLDKEDLIRPIIEEIKLLPQKKLLIDRHEIQWSQSLQEDRESPFYDFAKNFGFHGWVNLPIHRNGNKLYCLSFFNPEMKSIHPMELKVISEIQNDLEVVIK